MTQETQNEHNMKCLRASAHRLNSYAYIRTKHFYYNINTIAFNFWIFFEKLYLVFKLINHNIVQSLLKKNIILAIGYSH